MDIRLWKQELEQEGRVWARGALGEHVLKQLEGISTVQGLPGRRLTASAALLKLIDDKSELGSIISQLVKNARPIRALIFDKSKDMNWSLPWHQDRVIALKEKHKLQGFKAWTKKPGIWHAEPPLHILENMVFVRIHLDDNMPSSGALELALGSHKYGRIPSPHIKDIISKSQTEVCSAKRGDVLIVKALTVHRSLKSEIASSRRTLRIDYSGDVLPPPLEWGFAKSYSNNEHSFPSPQKRAKLIP